ncbi:helix-turn-helix domain-containing protein [Phascolarctobacterium succinatutens]
MENLELLVRELCKYKDELPWLEFKHNNYDPDMIGADISALANGATLDERNYAYFLWGIDDKTHEIVGTEYNLQTLKKGNQELENWLRGSLSPNADFEYQITNIDGRFVGVLIIHCAVNNPVTFKKVDYIRVGSYTKKLIDHPVLQSRLWKRLHDKKYEELIAKQDMSSEDVLRCLDYSVYFELSKIPQPESRASIIHYLKEDGCIIQNDNGLYSVTNMGAILLANKLADFPKLARKALRII